MKRDDTQKTALQILDRIGEDADEKELDAIEMELRRALAESESRAEQRLKSNVGYNMRMRLGAERWLQFLRLCEDEKKSV